MLESRLIDSLIQMRDDIPNDMEFGGRVRFLLGRYLSKMDTRGDMWGENNGGISEQC